MENYAPAPMNLEMFDKMPKHPRQKEFLVIPFAEKIEKEKNSRAGENCLCNLFVKAGIQFHYKN